MHVFLLSYIRMMPFQIEFSIFSNLDFYLVFFFFFFDNIPL